MIARRQDPAASLMEARNALTVCPAQPVARIDSEEPELVDVRCVENTQYIVIAVSICFTIARRDFVTRRTKMIAQQRESIDVPVVFDVGNGRLQQDVNRISHVEILGSFRQDSKIAGFTG